ncbi:MAG: Macrolide export ATP-binding/permease protein MacB [Bacteroidetes bacterium ADurb.Bin302]|nr:MAG: Macrolide export ATP-binding/permease protein MacB [Bacteroidetes bacterium ADurb.Bin302]
MIQIHQLHKTYTANENLHVLCGIDIDIKQGEFVSIMGASGSGKSTLLNIIGLLDQFDKGSYLLDNEEMFQIDEDAAADIRLHKIGFIFQSFNLIPYKTALDNISLPLFYQKINKKERDNLAIELLKSMNLEKWKLHYPSELSGGQKQRVAIARAIITRPKVILADEPTGALDSSTSKDILLLLRQINKQYGSTIVMVTHDPVIAQKADRIIRINDGIVEC